MSIHSVGQHNGGGISEQNGRYQIPISSSTDKGNLDMVSGTSSGNQSPVSTGETKYQGRLPIETSTGQGRLGTESGVFFGNRQVVGSHGGGPFRHSLFNSAATFLQLEGRPRGSGNGCFFTSLEREGHPPRCLITRTLQKVKLEGATLVLITPLWKAQPWFPLILEMLIDLLLLLPVGKDTLHPSNAH